MHGSKLSNQGSLFWTDLDLEYSYHEEVTVTPHKYPIHFRQAADLKEHYAMIGMATVAEGYPLYYDATNEKGLSMAGLNFLGNADYKETVERKDNITPFEFIPWILGQCANVAEARELLARMNMVKISFSEELPLSPLHWILSDKKESLPIEEPQNHFGKCGAAARLCETGRAF